MKRLRTISRPGEKLRFVLGIIALLMAALAASASGEPLNPEVSCNMTNVTSTASWVFQGGFVSGEGIYTFFNPEDDCGPSPYPYEVTAFEFMFGGSTSQVDLDIVVYDAAMSGDSCDGPGLLLYRTTIQAKGTSSNPIQYSFTPGELCVEGPFFMGLEFHHSGYPGPGRQGDSPPNADRCENYIWSGGSYYDAIDFGFVYYPAFWVFGQTGQCQTSGACCDPYGECSINTQAACEAGGGVYKGDDTDCDPNPCSPSFGCTMTNTTGDDSWIFQGGFGVGEGHYTFYNPEEDCGGSVYPFELSAFRSMLGGNTATEDIDVVVYEAALSGDSCDGPGAELFRFTTSATGNDAVPNLFEFPSGQCCVEGPFFIGLEFRHSGFPGTGRESSGPLADRCENWILTQPGSVFYDAIDLGMTRYPGFWVYGEPESAGCDGCCTGIRGNANGDASEDINISDITYLVDYLFGIPLGPAPDCLEEGNANGDTGEDINISDITYLVEYLFGVPLGPAPPACP